MSLDNKAAPGVAAEGGTDTNEAKASTPISTLHSDLSSEKSSLISNTSFKAGPARSDPASPITPEVLAAEEDGNQVLLATILPTAFKYAKNFAILLEKQARYIHKIDRHH